MGFKFCPFNEAHAASWRPAGQVARPASLDSFLDMHRAASLTASLKQVISLCPQCPSAWPRCPQLRPTSEACHAMSVPPISDQ